MTIFDLNQLADNSLIDADLCIVGSGPAGISIANEFARMNIRVLVLESGHRNDVRRRDLGLAVDHSDRVKADIAGVGDGVTCVPVVAATPAFSAMAHVQVRVVKFDDPEFAGPEYGEAGLPEL
jgi:choline dehydrogenase-like flavoprotein